MSKTKAFVGLVSPVISDDLTKAANNTAFPTDYSLQDGRVVRLDNVDNRATTWAAVLESRKDANLPVYLEYDSESSSITNVLLPRQVLVESISSSDDASVLEVQLLISHSKSFLRHSHPRFLELFNILDDALRNCRQLLVTITIDDHEIVDARAAPEVAGEPFRGTSLREYVDRNFVSSVTPEKAKHLFNLVNGKSCAALVPSNGCIPYLFPDDGCWGRAHEMCRMIDEEGVQARKTWIFGRLVVSTINHPRCEVRWGWHVAPSLLVQARNSVQVWIVDPSMFSEPVPEATWIMSQGDPGARTKDSDATVFYRNETGSVVEADPTYIKTKRVLLEYGDALRLRAVSTYGPPPYSNCSPYPNNIRSFGSSIVASKHP